MRSNKSSSEELQNEVKINNSNFIALLFMMICLIALVIVRGALFYYESGDYLFFLMHWVEQYRGMTFFEGLQTKVGTYNPPYMLLLNIIARINFSDLVLIKLISVIFDFILAFFIMKIVALKTDRLNMHILAFLLAFGAPTVILNGSMWGQCDSIYAAFAVGSVYFGLRGRSKATYAFMALAVSFKLQAVFLLPILPVFVFTNQIKIKDCYMFVVAYLATLLPVIIAGMPIGDALFAYVEQANYYSMLNMNIVNLWRFVGNVDYHSFRTAGIFIAGVVALGLMYFTYVNRTRLVLNVDFIRLAYLFAVIIPFILPKMHDRYYFMADALSILVFLFDKRRWYVPVVTVFCSYLGYAYFLMYGAELIDYRFAVFALLFVIIIVLRDFVISLYPGDKDSSLSSI